MELMVVVALIAVLVALLVPAVQAARESARRATCTNNLRQLALACQSHVTLLNHYPTGGWDSASTTIDMIGPGLGSDWRQPGGWSYTILPYLEQQTAFDTVNRSASVPAFACPTRRGSPLVSGTLMTDYAGNRGSFSSSSPLAASDTNRDTTFGMLAAVGTIPTTYPTDFTTLQAAFISMSGTLNTSQQSFQTGLSTATGGVIFIGSALPPARIRDGTANTYLLAEKYVPQAFYSTGGTGYEVVAYAGDSADTLRGGHRLPEGDSTPFQDARKGAFGGPHVAGFNAAFCDGAVRTIDFSIDAQTHFLLAAREDRQSVRPPD